MTPPTFTPRELDVMSVLWDLRTATVADVRDRLAADLAYTTVLSVLQTLEEKGFVGHETEGRAYRYHPLVDWQAAGRGELRRLLSKVFKGSPELLMQQLVASDDLGAGDLERLRDLVDQRLRDDDAEGGD